MGLQVIGAGLPRTGTTSLKSALEQLLGGPCYHMLEVNQNERDHGPLWWKAIVDDDDAALDQALDGYLAAVDWPASLLWPKLLARDPDAIIVLSHRGDAETWWKSVDKTVWAAMRDPDLGPTWAAFSNAMRRAIGLGDDWDEPAVAMKRYDDLYSEVVAAVPSDQLVIWQPGQGWEPLCAALGVAVPDDEFFHMNTTTEFRERAGFDES